MHALKKLKMKKVKNLFSSKDEVNRAFRSLEQKTEKAFEEFDRAKKKVREMSHLKYLD
jgi:hypothetical protein